MDTYGTSSALAGWAVVPPRSWRAGQVMAAVLVSAVFCVLAAFGLVGGAVSTAWAAQADRQAQDCTGSSSFTTVWADNNDADGARPATDAMLSGVGYVLQWQVAGGEEWVAFDPKTAAADLGLTDEQVEAIEGSRTVTVSGQRYVFSVDNLPTSYVDTDAEGAQTTVDLEWRVVRKGEIEGYSKLAQGAYGGAFDDVYYDGTPIECLQRMQDVTYTIYVHDGSGVLQKTYTPEEWNAAFGGSETESVLLDNEVIATEPAADSTSAITVEGRSVTITTPRPAYYPDNSPLDYCMRHDASGTRQWAEDGTKLPTATPTSPTTAPTSLRPTTAASWR